jgi:hypothetical protein
VFAFRLFSFNESLSLINLISNAFFYGVLHAQHYISNSPKKSSPARLSVSVVWAASSWKLERPNSKIQKCMKNKTPRAFKATASNRFVHRSYQK